MFSYRGTAKAMKPLTMSGLLLWVVLGLSFTSSLGGDLRSAQVWTSASEQPVHRQSGSQSGMGQAMSSVLLQTPSDGHSILPSEHMYSHTRQAERSTIVTEQHLRHRSVRPMHPRRMFNVPHTLAAQPAKVWVSPSGSGTQSGMDAKNAMKNVTHAIDLVADGGTILFLEGTYHVGQGLDIGSKNISLLSSSGSGATSIVCRTSTSSDALAKGIASINLSTDAQSVTITGFTITNCAAGIFADSPERKNGFVDMLIVTDVVLNNNMVGFLVSHFNSTWTQCVFINATNRVGSLFTIADNYRLNGGYATMTNCRWENNKWEQPRGDSGLACVFDVSGTLVLNDSVFDGNTVSYAIRAPPIPLMGVLCIRSPGVWGNVQVINNMASSGSIMSIPQYDIFHCMLDDGCSFTMSNSRFESNRAMDGIVRVSNNKGRQSPILKMLPSFYNTSFIQNTGQYAGAFVIAAAYPIIDGCTFWGNHLRGVTEWFEEGQITSGADLSVLGDSPIPGTRAQISNSIFYGTVPGVPFSNHINSSSVYIYDNSLTHFVNCTFSVPADSPGLYIASAAAPTFTRCLFTTPPGGNHYNFTLVALTDATPALFIECTFFAQWSFPRVLAQRDALSQAIAIYVDSGASPTFTSCTFRIGHINETLFGGIGLFGAQSASPTISNCTFIGFHGGQAILGYHQTLQSRFSVSDSVFTGTWMWPVLYLMQQVTLFCLRCRFTDNTIYTPLVDQGIGIIFISEGELYLEDSVIEHNKGTALGAFWRSNVTLNSSLMLDNVPSNPYVPSGINVVSANIYFSDSTICSEAQLDLKCSLAPNPRRGGNRLNGSLILDKRHMSGCKGFQVDAQQVTFGERYEAFLCPGAVAYYDIYVGKTVAGLTLTGGSIDRNAGCELTVGTTGPKNTTITFNATSSSHGLFSLNITYEQPTFVRDRTYTLALRCEHATRAWLETEALYAGIFLPKARVSMTKQFWGMLLAGKQTTITLQAFNQFNERMLARDFPPISLRIDGAEQEFSMTSRDLDAYVTFELPGPGSYLCEWRNPNSSSLSLGPAMLTQRINVIWVGWIYIVGFTLGFILVGMISFIIYRKWKQTHDALKARNEQQARLLEEFTRAGPAQIQHSFLEKFECAEMPCVMLMDNNRQVELCCEFPGRWHRLKKAATYSASKVKGSSDLSQGVFELVEVFRQTDFDMGELQLSDTLIATVPPSYDGNVDTSCFTRFLLSLKKRGNVETWQGLVRVMLPGGQPAWVCEEHQRSHNLEPFKPYHLPKSVLNMMTSVDKDDPSFQYVEIPHPDMIPAHSAVHPIVDTVRRELMRSGFGDRCHITRIKVFKNNVLEGLFNQRYELLSRPQRMALARPWPPTATELRQDIINTLQQHLSRWRHNPQVDNNVNLDLVWHGAAGGENALGNIARLGFLNLAKLNNGWHGRGAYFSHYPEYSEFYACAEHNRTEFGEHALLLSWALLGQTYPVIARMDRPDDPEHAFHGGYPGHDSHYARVLVGGATSGEREQGYFNYDEVVIQQENQLLPQFIVYYHVDETLTSTVTSASTITKTRDSTHTVG